MKNHQGSSLLAFWYWMRLIAVTGSMILLGMLIYSRFDMKRWSIGSTPATSSAPMPMNQPASDSRSSQPVTKQPPKPKHSGPKKAAEASWVPTRNTPYHFRYNENSKDLVLIGQFYDVKVFLSRDAADAFLKMQSAAKRDGIDLQAVSGYRSHKDQEKLFNNQIIKRGSRLEASRLSAPAGYSEHHTGYALDIADAKDQQAILTLSFEQGKAFRWLQKNALAYGFELSFPKHNPMNVSYEPWHWRFVGSEAAQETFRAARTMPQSAEQRAMGTVPDQSY